MQGFRWTKEAPEPLEEFGRHALATYVDLKMLMQHDLVPMIVATFGDLEVRTATMEGRDLTGAIAGLRGDDDQPMTQVAMLTDVYGWRIDINGREVPLHVVPGMAREAFQRGDPAATEMLCGIAYDGRKMVGYRARYVVADGAVWMDEIEREVGNLGGDFPEVLTAAFGPQSVS